MNASKASTASHENQLLYVKKNTVGLMRELPSMVFVFLVFKSNEKPQVVILKSVIGQNFGGFNLTLSLLISINFNVC